MCSNALFIENMVNVDTMQSKKLKFILCNISEVSAKFRCQNQAILKDKESYKVLF